MPSSRSQAARPPFLPCCKDDLGVAIGAEHRPALLELAPQFAIVVDLAVEDDDRAPSAECIGCGDPARSMIDNRRWPRPMPGAVQTPRRPGRDARGIVIRSTRFGSTGFTVS